MTALLSDQQAMPSCVVFEFLFVDENDDAGCGDATNPNTEVELELSTTRNESIRCFMMLGFALKIEV